jgi:hypothetical protein
MEAGGDQWLVLNLPAIAEEDDPLGREPGEALWPEWEDLQALERKRRASGEREWFALYQQRPHPKPGARIVLVRELVGLVPMMTRAADLAFLCFHGR